MKKIVFLTTFLGLSVHSLFAGRLWEWTGERYVLQDSGGSPFASYGGALDFIQARGFSQELTPMGLAYHLSATELMEVTEATGLAADSYFVLPEEDNSTGTIRFVLSRFQQTNDYYEGQPRVYRVSAKQTPGTKNVEIQAYVLLGTDPSSFQDKEAKVEFWFKSDPQSLQWEKCIDFEYGSSSSGQTLRQPGLIQNGSMIASWRAGNEKPNFSTQTGKIRVLVHYTTDVDGTFRDTSGWDGYEAENGPTFALASGSSLIEFSDQWAFDQMIVNNGIQRAGSFQGAHSLLAVYELTGAQLQELTGTSGIPDGKYAFGLFTNPSTGNTVDYIIPVQ